MHKKYMMTTEQFAYWLNGFFEMQDPKTLNASQTQMIKDHLDLVFKKETPDRKKPKLPRLTAKEIYNSASRITNYDDRKIC